MLHIYLDILLCKVILEVNDVSLKLPFLSGALRAVFSNRSYNLCTSFHLADSEVYRQYTYLSYH